MSNLRIATRYASALMALTNEQKKGDAVASDLQTVKDALTASHELCMVLASPVIPVEKKQTVLREVFKKKVGELVLGYLEEIAAKGRVGILPEVLDRYFMLRDEQLGIARVAVRTSVEFSAKQEKELVKQLEAMTKKKVEVTFSVDPSIKGGFIARVGDTVLDGSVKRQLEILKMRLQQGSFNN